MKNFNVFGVHWKIRLLKEGLGVHEKNNIKGGGDCLKGGRGIWTVCWFKEGLGKKEGVVFLRGVWYLDPHYEL